MSRLIDLTGKRFGKLTVIGRSPQSEIGSSRVFWDCRCDCGNLCTIDGWNLRKGLTRSCGCIFRSVVTKHGDSSSKLYKVWSGMKARCQNKNSAAYKFYGGKGITVCPEWHDYTEFKKWAIAAGYANGLTIDRIDPSGNYCPENCRWISQSENSQRTATNALTVNGITMSYPQWEQKIGMGKMSIEHWVKRHGEEYAVSRIDATLNPSKYSKEELNRLGVFKNKRRYLTINGEKLSYSAWSSKIGMSPQTVAHWVKQYGEVQTILRIVNKLELLA